MGIRRSSTPAQAAFAGIPQPAVELADVVAAESAAEPWTMSLRPGCSRAGAGGRRSAVRGTLPGRDGFDPDSIARQVGHRLDSLFKPSRFVSRSIPFDLCQGARKHRIYAAQDFIPFGDRCAVQQGDMGDQDGQHAFQSMNFSL